MALANVMDFGAVGDGVTDDTQAFIDALAAEYSVYVPAGTYRVNTIEVPNGTQIFGDGPATVIKLQSSPSWSTPFKGTALEDVELSYLAIDMNAESNFSCAVFFDGAKDCAIRHCYLYSSVSNGPWSGGPPWTLHAALIKGANNFVIEHCRTLSSQVKLYGQHVSCHNNVFRSPTNFGVSCVLSADEEVFSGISICDNWVIDPAGHGGIYVGSDINNNDVGTYRNLTVARNHVIGEWTHENACGINARPCRVSENWLIADNILHCESETPPNNGMGIAMYNDPGNTLTNCIVRDNTVKHVDQYGIALGATFKSVRVHGNILDDTRGISAAAMGGPSDMDISCNTISARIPQIIAHAYGGDFDVNLVGNRTGNSFEARAETGKTLTYRSTGNVWPGVTTSGAGTVTSA